MIDLARNCWFACPIVAVALSCAPKAEDANENANSGKGGKGGDGEDGTGGSSATGTDAGPTGSGGDLGLVGTPEGSGGSGSLTADAACSGLSAGAESITTEMVAPVALYVVLDNSGSMNQCADGSGGGGRNRCNSGPSKWDGAVDALNNFVQDPNSAGIDIALQYFHPLGASQFGDECNGAAHSVAAVSMGALPDNATNITSSLSGTNPNGDTPTVGALTGGTQFCLGFQAQNPDEKCVVVLVTDGQPNGCGLESGNNDSVDPNSAGLLTPIAASGLTGGVTTFTIGMAGVSVEGFGLLDSIAQAGGSDCTPPNAGDEACDVSMTGAQGFLDALNAIRDSVTITETTTLPCEFNIPDPPDGETFDAELVNVSVTTDGDVTQSLGGVGSAAECANVSGGWHYDDPANPSRIIICPQTCDTVTAITEARLDVFFGCATKPAILN